MQIPRTRQLKRAFQNFILTVVCGLTTILVLKGSTGFENPSSSGYKSENPHNYFTNPDHHPLIKFKKNPYLLTNHDRNPHALTSHNRPLHKSQSAHSHSDDDPSASELPASRSELQHARLLAEFNNLIHLPPAASVSNPLHSNPNPNPSFIRKKHLNLHPNLDQDTDLLNQIQTAAMDQDPDQKITAASDEQIRTQSRFATHHDHKPSILLVTGSQPLACDHPMGDYYLTKSLKNKMDYCRLHGLDIFYNMANLDPQMSGFWAKLPLVYTLMLAHPEKEWLWWLDSDAMITDMAFQLPMDRYKDYNLVLHGWNELVYEQKSWVGLNTGSFLIRNCQWSIDLLEAWAPMGPKGKVREEAGLVLSKALVDRPQFEADDQSALIYLLNEQKSKWASKVYLENAYFLHGYWLIIVDRYEEMMEKFHAGLGDERWPFVTHFVGCKPCSNKKLAFEGKCLEQMERAFNFADNQVLQFYGFQHEALNTHSLLTSTSVS